MKKKIGIILILISIGMMSLLIYSLVPKVQDYIKSHKIYREIEDTYTREMEKSEEEIERVLVDMEAPAPPLEYAPIEVDSEGLLRENPDYIGWIYIPKTDISYPVVKGSDNQEYLHKNFKGAYNFPGTIFMDAGCTYGEEDLHMILYGHNMRDGSMFAGLHKYKEETYLKEHPVFWFITPERKMLFSIFSVNEADPYDRELYGAEGRDYENTIEFQRAMEHMQERALYKIPCEIGEEDQVMSLSTCINGSDLRLLVSGVLSE